jgi:hypothetical protein
LREIGIDVAFLGQQGESRDRMILVSSRQA